jgi:hypothetical protein
MNGLENFILTVKGFDDLPASKKIDFFAYFLLIEKKLEGVTKNDISNCFDILHIEPYSNISSYLGNNSKGKSKKFLKKNSAYFLERVFKGTLDSGFGKIPKPKVSDSKYLPFDIFNGTRGYITKLAEQTIQSYDLELYDGCSVLTRKLLEILIIECFERHGIESSIKKPDGSFFYLSDLISELVKEPKWNLGRNTKQALPKIKKNGDLSAHNRRYIARKPDLDKTKDDLRIVIEELIHIIDYPNWK